MIWSEMTLRLSLSHRLISVMRKQNAGVTARLPCALVAGRIIAIAS